VDLELVAIKSAAVDKSTDRREITGPYLVTTAYFLSLKPKLLDAID
jgi:hypothetical protein